MDDLTKAETFIKYHDEHAKYRGASQAFHLLAASFLRSQAEQIQKLTDELAKLRAERSVKSYLDVEALYPAMAAENAHLREKNARLTNGMEAFRAAIRFHEGWTDAARAERDAVRAENARLKEDVDRERASADLLQKEHARLLAARIKDSP